MRIETSTREMRMKYGLFDRLIQRTFIKGKTSAADALKFGPTLRKAFLPIIMDDMIPAYIEKNRKGLEAEMKSRKP